MTFLPLVWQLPAIFTAVPLVHRLLPFKLAARAIPLFYAVISWLVMAMPDRIDLGLAAAGIVTILHRKFGLSLSTEEPADVQVAVAWCRNAYQVMTNLLVLGFDSLSLATRPSKDPTVHPDPGDGNPGDESPEHDEHPEPPKAPPEVIRRIQHL